MITQPRKRLNNARILLLVSGSICIFGFTLSCIGWGRKEPQFILWGNTIGVTALLSTGGVFLFQRELGEIIELSEYYQKADNIALEQQFKSGYTKGLSEAESELTEQFRGELAKIQEDYSLRWDSITQKHQSELAAVAKREGERCERRLTQLAEEKDKTIDELQGKLSHIFEEEMRLQSLKSELESKESQIKMEVSAINSDKLSIAEQLGRFDALNEKLGEKDRLISSLTSQLERASEEYAQALESQYGEGYARGVSETASQYSLELEKLEAVNAKLQAKLSEYGHLKQLDRNTPTLEGILLKNKNKPILKPFIITGSQGSGKALTAGKLIDIFRGKAEGAIAIVLDISEGGNPDSSWARLGIPCTNSPELFLEFLRQLKAELDNPNSPYLPFRNRWDEYQQAPPIVAIIDEVSTALDGQDKDFINECVNIFDAITTRGSKRKVFLGLLSQDDQIQNLSASPDKGATIKITNTGKLKNYLSIYLNDCLLSRATDEELKSNLGLKQYLNSFANSHFVAALEWHDSKGKFLKPIKHSSHYGHLLSESIPSQQMREFILPLADCPDWIKGEARQLYLSSQSQLVEGGNGLGLEELTSLPMPNPMPNPKLDPNPRDELERIYSLDSSQNPTPKPKPNSEPKAVNGILGVSKPTCPNCSSEKVIKAGKTKTGRQNYKCKNCGKKFSK